MTLNPLRTAAGDSRLPHRAYGSEGNQGGQSPKPPKPPTGGNTA